MVTRKTHKKLVWIDLESPTPDEIKQIMEEFHIHPLVGEELISESLRPKVDFYGNLAYLILHFPTVGHSHNGRNFQEVDFIIGYDFLITVHYELIDPLLEFSKMFEVNSVLNKFNLSEHAGFLFFYIMREFYRNVSQQISEISRDIYNIEYNIFSGNEQAMVESISGVNRKLIAARQAIRFHKDVLESFELAGRELFGEKFAFYLRAILGEYYEVSNHLDSQKETLEDLWKTNDSLLSAKTNRTMKSLAVMAAILLPVSIAGQLFGISSNNIPFMHKPYAFFIVLDIMIITALIMYFVAKRNKWL